MFHGDTLRTILGIIGNVISFGLFISPAPTFWTIIKRRDVEQFSPNPYLATVLNCAMWILYGLPIVHPHSLLVITINGIGLAIELLYVFIYLRFANKHKRLYVFKVVAIEIIFMAAVVLFTLLTFHTHQKRSLVVGILCIVFNVCMYGMPLDVMKIVIKTKSVEYMPFYLSLANFLNGCIWVGYAQIRFDLFMTISNGAGAFLGFIQLLLYGVYFKSTPKRDDKKQKQTPEVQISGDGKVTPSIV